MNPEGILLCLSFPYRIPYGAYVIKIILLNPLHTLYLNHLYSRFWKLQKNSSKSIMILAGSVYLSLFFVLETLFKRG